MSDLAVLIVILVGLLLWYHSSEAHRRVDKLEESFKELREELKRYSNGMKNDAPTSPEFDKFNSLVNRVLSVPKEQARAIVDEKPSPERRLLDLQYLRKEIEAEERHKSQVFVDPAQNAPGKL